MNKLCFVYPQLKTCFANHAYTPWQSTSPFLPLHYELCLTELPIKAPANILSYSPNAPGHQRPGRQQSSTELNAPAIHCRPKWEWKMISCYGTTNLLCSLTLNSLKSSISFLINILLFTIVVARTSVSYVVFLYQ